MEENGSSRGSDTSQARSLMAQLAIFFGCGAFALVEGYYWLVYVPRAWKNPGTNREIDDIRYVVRRCRGRSDEP